MVLQNSNNTFPQIAYYRTHETHSLSSQQVVVEINTSSLTAMQMVMDYINKQIDAIDKARIEMRKENPNFLPRLV